jgi:hypothetical protein
MPSRSSGLVDLTSLLPRFDPTDNPPITDNHDHTIHGSSLRKGEDVHSFDLFIEGVLERLANMDTVDKANNVSLHIGVFEWTRPRWFAIWGQDTQLSTRGRDLVRRGSNSMQEEKSRQEESTTKLFNVHSDLTVLDKISPYKR